MPITLTSPGELDADAQHGVRALAEAVEAEDGQPPLSDQALTQLRSTQVRHLVAHSEGVLVGYAQLDGTSLEIVGSADALTPLLAAFAEQSLLIWSHGKHSRLAQVLEQRGFQPVRTLHQLRLRSGVAFEHLAAPEGVEISPFAVGHDEDAWVAVNAAAFAHHPEQGGWTRSDVEAREGEPWFDPSGFLLAWRDATLVGFHWTKIHSESVGEVYVIGVDPSAQGTGLGKVLLQLGLLHLRERGCTEVLLYVDDDNTAAMRLYERTGFERYDVDVQWRSP